MAAIPAIKPVRRKCACGRWFDFTTFTVCPPCHRRLAVAFWKTMGIRDPEKTLLRC